MVPWGREWQPSPVFLPGEFHGQRSPVSSNPKGRKGSDTTQQLCTCAKRARLNHSGRNALPSYSPTAAAPTASPTAAAFHPRGECVTQSLQAGGQRAEGKDFKLKYWFYLCKKKYSFTVYIFLQNIFLIFSIEIFWITNHYKKQHS